MPGLEPAVDVAEREHTLGRGAAGVDRLLERHLAARQRAGLVTAQDVDAAEVLNGRQVLDDHLIARHPDGALRQSDGRDQRQELRRETDAKRHREQQRLERIAPERKADHQDQQHEGDSRLQDEDAEFVEPVLELGFRRARRESLGDAAELRGGSRGLGDSRCRPADHGGPQEHLIRRVLVDGQRLARQRRLLDREILRLDEPPVRRNQIAGRQTEHVAWHDGANRRLLPLPVAPHGRRRHHRRFELLRGDTGPKCLPEIQADAQHHDGDDDHGVGALTKRRRDDRGDEKNGNERRREEANELMERGQMPHADGLVRAVLREPPRSFSRSQALLGHAPHDTAAEVVRIAFYAFLVRVMLAT